MVRRVFIISKFTWINIVRRLWFWPHLLVLIYYSFHIYQENFEISSAVSSFDLMTTLVLCLMLFLGLNEGREELSRKTIIRLRTLPISWLDECLGVTMAIAVYSMSILFSVLVFLMCLYYNSNASEEVFQFIEIEKGLNYEGNKVILNAPKKLLENESLVARLVFRDEKMLSDVSAAMVSVKLGEDEKMMLLKSQRLNDFLSPSSEVKLPISFFFRKRELEIFIEELFIKEKGLSIFPMFLNGAMSLMIQGILMSYLFVLLGRKVSIEVGVFFVLGCLLINTSYSLLGDDLLKDNLDRLSRFENGSSNFKSHWWEPYLFKITKLLSYVEGFKSFFRFHSAIDNWKLGEMVEFPLFNIKFLKETISFMFIVALSSLLLKPRET